VPEQSVVIGAAATGQQTIFYNLTRLESEPTTSSANNNNHNNDSDDDKVFKCECTLNLPQIKALNHSQCMLPRAFRVSPYDFERNEYKTSTRASMARAKAQLRRVLGSVTSVRLASTQRTNFMCCDGRQQQHGSGFRTLGGDFAELAVALSFLHQHTKPLYARRVDELLYTWLDTPRFANKRMRFYYHTDTDAVKKIMRAVGVRILPHDDSLLDLVDVAPELQPAVLDALMLPEHQGCVHLRLMMSHPDAYGVSLDVLQWLLRAYFKLLWNRDRRGAFTAPQHLLADRLQFVLADGTHRERAWLDVFASDQCFYENASTIVSSSSNTQVFMSHPNAVQRLRYDMASFLVKAQALTMSSVHSMYWNVTLAALTAQRPTRELLTNTGQHRSASRPELPSFAVTYVN
jgi:hypothetical protein